MGKTKRSLGMAGWGKKMGRGQENVWSLPGMEERERRFGNGALETVHPSKHFRMFNKCSASPKRPPKER